MMEPHDITSVSIRALPPNPPECRTPQQTIAAIRARFPHCFTESGLAIFTRFAEMENKARWRRQGKTHKEEPRAVSADRYDNMRATWQAKSANMTDETLAAIEGEVTSGDVALRLGTTVHAAHERLRRLEAAGRVVQRKVKGMSVWQRKVEAVE